MGDPLVWEANCSNIQDLQFQFNEIQFQFNKIQFQFNENQIQFQFNENLIVTLFGKSRPNENSVEGFFRCNAFSRH